MTDSTAPGGPTTERVSVEPGFDGGPARHRIGLITLDSDVATERDFHHMLPDDVMFYSTRIPVVNPITVDNLRLMAPHLTRAARLLIPNQRLDAIAYSCTSGTVAMGYETVCELVRRAGREHTPVVTPITSAIAAMQRIGMQRISLLTPYIDSVNQSMRGFLEQHGITVASIGSFCLEDDNEMAEIAPAAILAAAKETCRTDVDGLFISCTALRAVEILEAAEAAIGKPVLSSIQTLFWQSLREAGHAGPVAGFGSLLRQH